MNIIDLFEGFYLMLRLAEILKFILRTFIDFSGRCKFRMFQVFAHFWVFFLYNISNVIYKEKIMTALINMKDIRESLRKYVIFKNLHEKYRVLY